MLFYFILWTFYIESGDVTIHRFLKSTSLVLIYRLHWMYIYVFPIKFYCFFNSWTTAWVPAWSRRTPVSWCTGGTPGPCPAPSGRSSVASLARRRTASLGCMRRRSGRLRSLVSVVINICCPRDCDAVSRTANVNVISDSKWSVLWLVDENGSRIFRRRRVRRKKGKKNQT